MVVKIALFGSWIVWHRTPAAGDPVVKARPLGIIPAGRPDGRALNPGHGLREARRAHAVQCLAQVKQPLRFAFRQDAGRLKSADEPIDGIEIGHHLGKMGQRKDFADHFGHP